MLPLSSADATKNMRRTRPRHWQRLIPARSLRGCGSRSPSSRSCCSTARGKSSPCLLGFFATPARQRSPSSSQLWGKIRVVDHRGFGRDSLVDHRGATLENTLPTTNRERAMIEALFTSARVGRLELEHRLAMAPMTRNRSRPDGVPTELNAEYYAQRSSLGLVISEGTQPSPDGQGYLLTPGIHTQAQAARWELVADAVHAAGARLFIQLMHVDRVAHPDNTPHGRQPMAPSAEHGYTDYPTRAQARS